MLLAQGGNGGWGNPRFKSSTNQAPRNANPGQEGVERTLWLRLKLIADAGLVGLPNAGKSTFLAAASNARPKIADYPFTTLHPGLGVVGVDGAEFVLADIPGLIEGAHEGRGLGDAFLGHVERCAVLLHLVDGTSETVGEDYRVIQRELEAYGDGLADKPRVLGAEQDRRAERRGCGGGGAAAGGGGGMPVLRLSGRDGAGACPRCCGRSGRQSLAAREPRRRAAARRGGRDLRRSGSPARTAHRGQDRLGAAGRRSRPAGCGSDWLEGARRRRRRARGRAART